MPVKTEHSSPNSDALAAEWRDSSASQSPAAKPAAPAAAAHGASSRWQAPAVGAPAIVVAPRRKAPTGLAGAVLRTRFFLNALRTKFVGGGCAGCSSTGCALRERAAVLRTQNRAVGTTGQDDSRLEPDWFIASGSDASTAVAVPLAECPEGCTRLNALRPGDSGTIRFVQGSGALRRRLLEMGMLPGTDLRVERVAPLGDPIELRVRGYYLSLRGEEARMVLVDTAPSAACH